MEIHHSLMTLVVILFQERLSKADIERMVDEAEKFQAYAVLHMGWARVYCGIYDILFCLFDAYIYQTMLASTFDYIFIEVCLHISICCDALL